MIKKNLVSVTSDIEAFLFVIDQVPPAPSEQTPTTEEAAQVLTQKPRDSVMEVGDFVHMIQCEKNSTQLVVFCVFAGFVHLLLFFCSCLLLCVSKLNRIV